MPPYFRRLPSDPVQLIDESQVKAIQNEMACNTAPRPLVDGVFTEWREAPRPGEYTNRKPYVNSLRRFHGGGHVV